MEFRDIFVMSLIVGLFAFGLFYSIMSMQSENPGGSADLSSNPSVSKVFGNISKQLNTSSSEADTARKGLIEEEKNPVVTSLGFVFKSILAAGNTFMSMGINMFTYIFSFAAETLNIPPIVTGTIMSIIIGILVLAIWSVVRAGR